MFFERYYLEYYILLKGKEWIVQLKSPCARIILLKTVSIILSFEQIDQTRYSDKPKDVCVTNT